MKGSKKQITTSPAVVALQWFTYAMWGWLCIGFAWLIGTSVAHYLEPSFNDSGAPGVAYSLAACIVLFITAQISDMIYVRWDNSNKHGASMVVMVLHAVLFALLAIGSLILSVFAMTSLLIGDGFGNDENGRIVMLITGFVIALMFGLLTLRVVWPSRIPRQQMGYRLLVAVVAVVAFGAALFGPAAYTYQTRPDRLIEAGLPLIARDINSYVSTHNKLPVSIRDVTFSDEKSRRLVEQNRVEYEANTDPKVGASPDGKSVAALYPSDGTNYYYQLCVTYMGQKNQDDRIYYTESYPSISSSEPNVYSHTSGRVCYNLVAYDFAVQPAVDVDAAR